MATKRQKALADAVHENLRHGRKIATVGELARSVGYSQSTSEHPKDNITDTKGFKEALNDRFKNDRDVDIQEGLMTAEVLDNFPFELACADEKITEIIKAMGCRLLSIAPVPIIGKKIAYFAAPNGRIRAIGMDQYHKIQGNYAPTKVKVGLDDIDDMSEPELDERLADTEPMAERYKKFSKQKKLEKARTHKKR